jgi:hypothetical protein
MSTSLLYHGFGIRGIVYKRIEYKDRKILVWVETPREQLKCATCESKEVRLRGKKIRQFRSVPIETREWISCILFHVLSAGTVIIYARQRFLLHPLINVIPAVLKGMYWSYADACQCKM